jgi:2-methylcitrate dehydratase PrpD
MNCWMQPLVSKWAPNTVTVPTQCHSSFSPTQNCLKKVGLVSWPVTCFHNDVYGLLKKVCVQAKHEYTNEYSGKMPATITLRFQDGQVIKHGVQDYPGLASHPFTWEGSVEKFDRLVAGRVDEGLCREIKDAVHSLESIQVADLMALLGRVKGITAVRH